MTNSILPLARHEPRCGPGHPLVHLLKLIGLCFKTKREDPDFLFLSSDDSFEIRSLLHGGCF